MRLVKAASIVFSGLVVFGSLCGCLVAGYSSRGGWWIWPGSLVLTLVLVLAWLLTRR
jgi:hypothetical protein